ncbi:M23 family metallopeptidase [Candidimonas sp. SYP-B2681]|uniref:M23 family metallopeptidase n=1 Tax=Candidimonas sp. SYP-B2681 TaxID=2497686 RepID=UPI000F871C89|nr:M23 family metallopeptidase [Candidimonas sp. SYP-B2681]RTZ44756.1 M23 family metallopeptidase [Candidimonas sp. SYP-B2681]
MGNRKFDSSGKGLRTIVVTLLAGAAMAASAVAGAWVQSQLSKRPVLNVDQERAISELASRDSAYIRENVNLLASKVGDLQAKLITMDGLSKRVAEAAGVSYTDPEIHASLEDSAIPVMDYITDESGAPWTAQGLGRQLDALQQQLTEQKDWFAMLDLVLTRRAGVEARLPTYTPVDYPYLSSSFGWRRNPVTGRHAMHEGLDFAAPKGTPIHAASGGVVTEAGYRPDYGKLVEINHGNGLLTRYAHASAINVKRGDLVEKGHLIARVGSTGRSTGAHLHFEVRMAGHPLDPTLFLAKPQASDALIVDASEAVEAILPQVR